ncbi:MAG TPA: UPF0182 family protein, partial [Chroococcales cyanobacterium]
MGRRLGNRIFQFITLLLGLWLSWDLLSHLVGEIFWFTEVGYLPVLLRRLQTQLGLLVVVFSLSTSFLLGNLWLANRLKYPVERVPLEAHLNTSIQNLPTQYRRQGVGRVNSRLRVRDELTSQPAQNGPESSTPLSLRSLLPITTLLSLLVGVMLLHYSKIALSYWHSDLSLPRIIPPLPSPLGWSSFGQLWSLPIWSPIGLAVIVILLVINPQFWLNAIATVLSVFFALILSGHWSRILQYFQPTPFNTVEPLFERDISFYIFNLPVWQLLDFWLRGLFLFSLGAVALTYLLSGDSFSQGKFPGFSSNQLRHLYGLGTLVAAIAAFHHWLSRYELLYSTRGVAYGASYTDVNAQLPINTSLSICAGAIALYLLLRTIVWFRRSKPSGRGGVVALGLYLAAVGLVGTALPEAIQRFSVQPNELARERPYIQRSIGLTRTAFDLASIDVETFNPEGALTRADLQNNDLTIRNIRLWDTRPLLQTNRQLQQIRLYYKFPSAQIDRYTLKVEAKPPLFSTQNTDRTTTPNAPIAEKQQVIIAARELDYSAVPQQAQTWVNKHLVYTHGYGFTLSPVNTVNPGGLPDYYVKNIGTGVAGNGAGELETSSEAIRESIPTGTPRIYYGEIANTYVMTATKVKEFDYPSGDDNVYNTYDGNGGVALDRLWRRLIFAQYLKDWQMLFTRNFTPQTRLLFRRNINQRIRAIAPFLRYDKEPYLVAAKGSDTNETGTENYLYWVVDAYTTSAHYPYSDPGNNKFNYIRNSVKVVIDAYHGDVDFYVADFRDPIVQTWSAIFPKLFQPLDAMPATLRSHIRYPLDFFSVQSERLLTYHMTDPQVFYNREDLWRIPQEIYGT